MHIHSAGFFGVFGLCVGGSVISILEFVYYFTIRFYGNYDEKTGAGQHENKEKRLAYVHSKYKMFRNVNDGQWTPGINTVME